jgi:hypothetical protein
MTTYGVTPLGFVRKQLTDILADIEAAAIGVFGAGVIQAPESPLGQLNGLMTSIATTAWEIAESTYQSYDPDQAEGTRLEMLGRIRLLERIAGEQDEDYRAAITNEGRARLDLADIERGVASVSGVSWVKAFTNRTDAVDANGMDPRSVAVAVIGGADAEVAAALRAYIVPGVPSVGNTIVSITVEGYCRSITFIRPNLTRVGLALTVSATTDSNGCPPPSGAAIAAAASANLLAMLINGDDVTLHVLRTAISCKFPNVQLISATASLPDVSGAVLSLPLAIDFFSLVRVAASDVTVAFT